MEAIKILTGNDNGFDAADATVALGTDVKLILRLFAVCEDEGLVVILFWALVEFELGLTFLILFAT